MRVATRALFESIVDYAGTFPPASLSLEQAVASYAEGQRSPHAWMLGRLILPAAALDDFDTLARRFLNDADVTPWPLSVIMRGDTTSEFRRIVAFNDKWAGRAVVRSVEFPPTDGDAIERLKADAGEHVEVFFETPLDANVETRLDAIQSADAAAKVRTGGVTAAAFPSPFALAQFLVSCAKRRLPFKATAGLHHAIRSCYPLTYEPGSASTTMHGFLNVAVASALAHAGADTDAVADALGESSLDAFRFGSDGLSWRGSALSVEDLAAARRRFFRSFGSCSFREPVAELA